MTGSKIEMESEPFGAMNEMKEKAKSGDDRNSPLWAELHEKAKDDPQLANSLRRRSM
jgi:hypothetical protein